MQARHTQARWVCQGHAHCLVDENWNLVMALGRWGRDCVRGR